MSHNRIHANKSTYDNRSQQRQSKRPQTLTEMYQAMLFGSHYLGGDKPSWKWQARGKFEYTHDTEAARYVAACKEREALKALSRVARHNYKAVNDLLNGVATTAVAITDSARLIEAASHVPDRRAAA